MSKNNNSLFTVDHIKCMKCEFFKKQKEKEDKRTFSAFDLAFSMRYYVEHCPHLEECPQRKEK